MEHEGWLHEKQQAPELLAAVDLLPLLPMRPMLESMWADVGCYCCLPKVPVDAAAVGLLLVRLMMLPRKTSAPVAAVEAESARRVPQDRRRQRR